MFNARFYNWNFDVGGPTKLYINVILIQAVLLTH